MKEEMIELLENVKTLTEKAESKLNSIQVLKNNGGLLNKEALLKFPIQDYPLDWSKSHELGNNILGIRIASDLTIRFILRAVNNGNYENHYHDCPEKVTVLNSEGELTFYFGEESITINSDNTTIHIEEGIEHSVDVKKGSHFQVDFV